MYKGREELNKLYIEEDVILNEIQLENRIKFARKQKQEYLDIYKNECKMIWKLSMYYPIAYLIDNFWFGYLKMVYVAHAFGYVLSSLLWTISVVYTLFYLYRAFEVYIDGRGKMARRLAEEMNIAPLTLMAELWEQRAIMLENMRLNIEDDYEKIIQKGCIIRSECSADCDDDDYRYS